MKLYFDISDLVHFSSFSSCVSGIQRVVLSLCVELQTNPDVEFVYCNSNGQWYTVRGINMSEQTDLKIFDKINTNWRITKIRGKTFRRMLRDARGLGKIRTILRLIKSRLIRRFVENSRVSCGNYTLEPISFSEKRGILFIPSIPQQVDIFRQSLDVQNRMIQVAYFVHDVIPVVCPEFTWLDETERFRKYIELVDRTASLVLTSAQYNVKDISKYIEKTYNKKSSYPIKAIGLPVEFNIRYTLEDYFKISPVTRKLKHYRYALVVGSIGPRKNHFEILQAWRRFYESDAYNNEVLVVAGSPWPSAPDIVSQLRTGFCGGSVIFIEAPCDEELSFLYEHCYFTICASLYEGWGLPVSESISVGKPVVILDLTTLPEAGFGVANVVKSRDLNEMCNMITRLFTDESYYKQSLKKVFELRDKRSSWADFAKKVLICCEQVSN